MAELACSVHRDGRLVEHRGRPGVDYRMRPPVANVTRQGRRPGELAADKTLALFEREEADFVDFHHLAERYELERLCEPRLRESRGFTPAGLGEAVSRSIDSTLRSSSCQTSPWHSCTPRSLVGGGRSAQCHRICTHHRPRQGDGQMASIEPTKTGPDGKPVRGTAVGAPATATRVGAASRGRSTARSMLSST